MKNFLKKAFITFFIFSLIFTPLVSEAGFFETIGAKLAGMGKLAAFGPTVAAFSVIGQLLMSITAVGLMLSGILFDKAVSLSILGMSSFIGSTDAIKVGWAMFRDLVNMFLIFILLYISIRTIIGVGNFDPKKMIKNVIIVALFINFSLFATRLVIDTSNILAVGMYNNILKSVTKGEELKLGDSLTIKAIGPSWVFMKPMHLAAFYNLTEGSPLVNLLTGDSENKQGILEDLFRMPVAMILGSVVFLVVSFVFFASAFMFITRFITLIFLMVVSPVAFGSMAFPGLNKWWDQWLGKLLHHAFFAPIYMFVIYFVAYFINDPSFVNGGGGANGDLMGVILNMVIIVGMLLGGLMLANQFSISGSKWAQGAAGGLAVAGTSFLGRQTIGRVGDLVSKNQGLRDARDAGGVSGTAARLVLKGADNLAKSSFDVRKSGVAKQVAAAAGLNLGSGILFNEKFGEGGFRGKATAEKAELDSFLSDNKNKPDKIAKQILRQEDGMQKYIYEKLSARDRVEVSEILTRGGNKIIVDRLQNGLSPEELEKTKKAIGEKADKDQSKERLDIIKSLAGIAGAGPVPVNPRTSAPYTYDEVLVNGSPSITTPAGEVIPAFKPLKNVEASKLEDDLLIRPEIIQKLSSRHLANIIDKREDLPDPIRDAIVAIVTDPLNTYPNQRNHGDYINSKKSLWGL